MIFQITAYEFDEQGVVLSESTEQVTASAFRYDPDQPNPLGGSWQDLVLTTDEGEKRYSLRNHGVQLLQGS